MNVGKHRIRLSFCLLGLQGIEVAAGSSWQQTIGKGHWHCPSTCC